MSEVNKPELKGYVMSFDIGLGVRRLYLGKDLYAERELGYSNDPHTYGALDIITNTTLIRNILFFNFRGDDDLNLPLSIGVISYPNDDSGPISALGRQDLDITVDGVIYHLGSSQEIYVQDGKVLLSYQNADVKKLFAMAMQAIGETKRFCLNWQ
ncbi:hypothetical protein [Xenorhabdus bovienii]|uniref:DUF7823 domain-containing protein n=2 Tax=Xenorhabdus bovienii TaxID=40576 RepID=A0A0B6XD24_XENBV|nr:hypothetical protein [Xenorhabdus bovienii]CDG87312.1 conserved hypothetical protein [Xenorhabdus bovienii str. feltiae France]CDG90630.1 conserved hypothetical protein [Xenorhabdus bovienii str. feltiae Florida]CDG99722.1 conserved hypothetical protein [Xenorhabdus bovienii str. feltiae Moldova]CDM90164.1 conserved protein of unknown function [Xenorhabdus bovienii]